MSESYQRWDDKELMKDHEANPESFRQWREPSDAELIERIEYLRIARHLGTWGERELSKSEAQATARKIKTR